MNLLEGVNQLPRELREQILGFVVQAKLKDKKSAGWDKVHDELLLFVAEAPYCEIEELPTKVTKCGICDMCRRNGRCWVCWQKNSRPHFVRLARRRKVKKGGLRITCGQPFVGMFAIGWMLVCLLKEKLSPNRKIIEEVLRVLNELKHPDRVSLSC